MGIIGLNGLPIDAASLRSADDIIDDVITDDNAEAADEAARRAKDVESADELGVRFFYPLDYEKEELRGTKIPKAVRDRARKEALRQKRAFERHMAQPMKRSELEAMFQNSIAPIGRQAQTLTFQFIALRNILQAKFGITEEEIQQETAKVIATYRKDAASQAEESAKAAAESVLIAARERRNAPDEPAAPGSIGGSLSTLSEEA
jgi:hypothetical protein